MHSATTATGKRRRPPWLSRRLPCRLRRFCSLRLRCRFRNPEWTRLLPPAWWGMRSLQPRRPHQPPSEASPPPRLIPVPGAEDAADPVPSPPSPAAGTELAPALPLPELSDTTAAFFCAPLLPPPPAPVVLPPSGTSSSVSASEAALEPAACPSSDRPEPFAPAAAAPVASLSFRGGGMAPQMKNPSAVGLLRVEEPKVPIATSTVRCWQYQMNEDAVSSTHKMIRDLKTQGLVSKTHSPFNSPIWPMRKSDRERRLTVDYHGLNEVTPPLSAAVLDMLELQYELESKAAKCPTICHGLIQAALEKDEAPEHLQYIDDIIVCGNTAAEVFEKGEKIIQILLEVGFAIKKTKVKGPAQEIQFLRLVHVWATDIPGKSQQATPIIIELIPGARPVVRKQYPLRLEDRKGIEPIITRFLELGLLIECESDFNTPILPVKKPNGAYRLVQDLRAVNEITKTLHPVVANPYTLLTKLKDNLTWFTVLDLKDAFFCLPLAPESQKIFAFEWESVDRGRKTQLTWTVLPQGYKNSPTIFGNQLAKELEQWERPLGDGTLLQYVDDLLIATETEEECIEWTISLLNFLGLSGYRVSQQKAQLVQEEVVYLGYEVSRGQRSLGAARKEAICQMSKPETVRDLRAFLGMTGWCRLWIYQYGILAKPLYDLLKESKGVLVWTPEAKGAYKRLKQELMRAPALGLPDVTKPFWLFSHERQGMALGVLAQQLGPHKRAVAYFSKQLDEVSKGWPGCLRAVAAVIINIEEARKLTLGQKMTVLVAHTVSAVLEQKGNHWLSPSRFLKYQAILAEADDVTIQVTNVVNPASFLEGKTSAEPIEHNCLETIEAVYSSRPDLKEEPFEDADDWFSDGSSFVKQGVRMAGYAVTTTEEVIESNPLPAGTSAQKAELIALTRALELAENMRINIWTDSKYAFSVVHAHGAIWKERGLLTTQGKTVKHAEEILRLLEAVQLPAQVAIMHCKGHLKAAVFLFSLFSATAPPFDLRGSRALPDPALHRHPPRRSSFAAGPAPCRGEGEGARAASAAPLLPLLTALPAEPPPGPLRPPPRERGTLERHRLPRSCPRRRSRRHSCTPSPALPLRRPRNRDSSRERGTARLLLPPARSRRGAGGETAAAACGCCVICLAPARSRRGKE
ncbi:uncharacterized protein [Molothrus aeneus]|uniref:uncharacterized protein n=1 Tax=Molothrus aeneus TaxID=84833 RepID=UPI003459A811